MKPNRISTYFKQEKWILVVVTVTGIIYNVGMVAGPWFEGKLAQMLFDIIGGKKNTIDMIYLALLYILVIIFVQVMRYFKRLYVRKFANNVNKNMKQVLYGKLVSKSKRDLDAESTGSLMTKAIQDVDACSEGMRKFTTEIFDTGIVMISYLVMLFTLDYKLAAISLIFPPFAYIIAERLKVVIHKYNDEYKKSSGRLNDATMNRVGAALTYRVYGLEEKQDKNYEKYLEDYEKRAVLANIYGATMQPIYELIAMISVIFILFLGGRNVLGTGFVAWNIASFTTFLSCFTKLAVKSSKAAKLFNAVQKATVSWRRILPLLSEEDKELEKTILPKTKELKLTVSNVSFNYPESENILENISFELKSGQILGVMGPVACGKSTLGRVFLNEYPYAGNITIDGIELKDIANINEYVGYLGHEPELLSDSISNNVLLGDDLDINKYLQAVCIAEEVAAMPEGVDTLIGQNGVKLSGGQRARIALARTIAHKKPIMILDDPFSAVDYDTEDKIFEYLRTSFSDSIIILISHRTRKFDSVDKVIKLESRKQVD